MTDHHSAPDGGLTVREVTVDGHVVSQRMPETTVHYDQGLERDRRQADQAGKTGQADQADEAQVIQG